MQRLLREMAAAKAEHEPTREEVAHQLNKAKRELAEFRRMKTVRETKGATERMFKAQIHQQLLTIQEREEGKIVRKLEAKLGVNFRTGKIVK